MPVFLALGAVRAFRSNSTVHNLKGFEKKKIIFTMNEMITTALAMAREE